MNTEMVYQEMLHNMYEGIYFVDTQRQITFWNKGAERITGFGAGEVVGKHCFSNILNHVDQGGNQLCLGGCPLHQTIEDGQVRENAVFLHHRQGHRVPVTVKTTPIYAEGKIVGAVEVFIDDGEKIRLSQQIEDLEMLAYRDQLTGLANRRYVENQLRQRLLEAEELELPFGLVFADIDHFKHFNDAYGHALGDEVLKLVAANFSCLTLSLALAGRWGGEEFVCLLNTRDPDSLLGATEKMRMLVEKSSLRVQADNLAVTISLGATLYRPGDTLDTLIARADALMYQSKSRGRNCVTVE